MQIESKRFARRALVVALFVILAEVLCENFIVEIFNEQTNSLAFWLLLAYSLLQVVFAPIQSGFSDFVGRRRSLQVSLFASFLSFVILLIHLKNSAIWITLLFLSTLIKGAAGNNLPLALSVIADTQGQNYRFSFALSSGTYAIAYLLFAANMFKQTTVNYILILLVLVLMLVCVSPYFKDVEDKEDSNFDEKPVKEVSERSFLSIIKHEPALVRDELRQPSTRQALAAFLLWEISMYSIIISQLDFKFYTIAGLAISMMLGYITGVISLKFCSKISDSLMIRRGYYISTLSLVPYFFFLLFSFENPVVLQICFYFHAIGNALLSPTFMSILAKEKAPHEQGKRYGLVESVDTIAFLIGTFTVMLFNFLEVPIFGLIIFSFLSFILSWRFYGRFKNLD